MLSSRKDKDKDKDREKRRHLKKTKSRKELKSTSPEQKSHDAQNALSKQELKLLNRTASVHSFIVRFDTPAESAESTVASDFPRTPMRSPSLSPSRLSSSSLSKDSKSSKKDKDAKKSSKKAASPSPPSTGSPRNEAGLSKLLPRNRSFNHEDRARISKTRKGVFSRTKSIERVLSHQIVIEDDFSDSSLSEIANAPTSRASSPSQSPPVSPVSSSTSLSSTAGAFSSSPPSSTPLPVLLKEQQLAKKRHHVKRKSLESLVTSTLNLRSPRSSSSSSSTTSPSAPATPLASSASATSSSSSSSQAQSVFHVHSTEETAKETSKKRGNPIHLIRGFHGKKEATSSSSSSSSSSASASSSKNTAASHSNHASSAHSHHDDRQGNAAPSTSSRSRTRSPTGNYALHETVLSLALGTVSSLHQEGSSEDLTTSISVGTLSDAGCTSTISEPDLAVSRSAHHFHRRELETRGRSNSTVEDNSPRLARLLSPSRRPSIGDLRDKHIWIDADGQRKRRLQIAEKLTRFFETMYADPWAKPLPIFLDGEDSAKHLLSILDDHVLSYDELQFHSADTPIGEGAYSEVFRATYRGQDVAVKRLRDVEKHQAAILRAFEREVVSLKRTAGMEEVISFVGACVQPRHVIVTAFQCGGSLHSAIHERHAGWSLDEQLAKASRIATGVSLLHALSPPLLHRDLTSFNIFLGPGDVPYIGDFGISRFRASGQPTSPIGHPRWKAPEIHRNAGYTAAADVYMLATILFEIFYRRKPFSASLPDKDVARLLARGHVPSIPDDSAAPPLVVQLIASAWANEPFGRPPAHELARCLDSLRVPLAPSSSSTATSSNIRVRS